MVGAMACPRPASCGRVVLVADRTSAIGEAGQVAVLVIASSEDDAPPQGKDKPLPLLWTGLASRCIRKHSRGNGLSLPSFMGRSIAFPSLKFAPMGPIPGGHPRRDATLE